MLLSYSLGWRERVHQRRFPGVNFSMDSFRYSWSADLYTTLTHREARRDWDCHWYRVVPVFPIDRNLRVMSLDCFRRHSDVSDWWVIWKRRMQRQCRSCSRAYPIERGSCVSWFDATINLVSSRRYPVEKFLNRSSEKGSRCVSLPISWGKESSLFSSRSKCRSFRNWPNEGGIRCEEKKQRCVSNEGTDAAVIAYFQLIIGHDQHF